MSANLDNDPEFTDAVSKPRSRRGFRLGKLMVVVAIIAVLIALLLAVGRSFPGSLDAWRISRTLTD
jgi:hypothetical protein